LKRLFSSCQLSAFTGRRVLPLWVRGRGGGSAMIPSRNLL
jgi:hypothetical protein